MPSPGGIFLYPRPRAYTIGATFEENLHLAVSGHSIDHDDLRLLTEFGFTPYEALQTATVNAAYVVEKMSGNNDFGTIEIGKRADLVLLSSNPLDDINNTQAILGVMARGRWYPAKELKAMLAIDD